MTEIEEYSSNQEETDSRIILYLRLISTVNDTVTVIVRSPDSDVFILLLCYSHKFTLRILLDTGTGEHRRLIDVTELSNDLGVDLCKSILPLYVFTGEDTNGAFRGKGKVQPLKKLLAHPKFLGTFMKLGRRWRVPEDLFAELEEFTCILYNASRTKSVDLLRASKLKQMVGKSKKLSKKKIDISRLPPLKQCLTLSQHIKRVNYRVAQWKRSHWSNVPLPCPTDHGWRRARDSLVPEWSDGPAIPDTLDLLLRPQVPGHYPDSEEMSVEDVNDSNQQQDSDEEQQSSDEDENNYNQQDDESSTDNEDSEYSSDEDYD